MERAGGPKWSAAVRWSAAAGARTSLFGGGAGLRDVVAAVALGHALGDEGARGAGEGAVLERGADVERAAGAGGGDQGQEQGAVGVLCLHGCRAAGRLDDQLDRTRGLHAVGQPVQDEVGSAVVHGGARCVGGIVGVLVAELLGGGAIGGIRAAPLQAGFGEYT